MSSDEPFDLSKPLPSGEKRKIFVIHKGSLQDKKTGESQLMGVITSRLKKEDADSVASVLNKALEYTWYLEYLASKDNTSGEGDADTLRELDTEKSEAEWEKLFAPHRRPVYIVTGLWVTDESVEEYDRTFSKGKEAA